MYWSEPKRVTRYSNSYSIKGHHNGCILTVHYNDHSDIYYFAGIDKNGNSYNSMRHRLGYVNLQDAQDAAIQWAEGKITG